MPGGRATKEEAEVFLATDVDRADFGRVTRVREVALCRLARREAEVGTVQPGCFRTASAS